MAIPTFSEFQEGKTAGTNTKKEKLPSFDEFNKTFVSTAKPSTLGKVASFLAPTITKTISKAQHGEGVTARDIGGSALEAASYLIPGGAIAKGVGLGVKAGTLASKIAVPAAIGGVSGATFGAGQAVAGGEGIGGVAKEALKTGAIGTVAGGAIGGALSKLGTKLPKAVEEVQPTVDEVNNLRVFGTKERPVENAGKIIPPEAEAQPVAPIAQVAKEVPQSIQKSPEYIKSVDDRAQNMATKDPEFNPSSDAAKIIKFDEVSKATPKEQMIKWGTGIDRNTPEGLPATTIRGLVEEDMLANPSKYTADEIFRISTSNVNSEAGAALQGVKVKSGKIAETPMDFIRQEQAKLQEKIRAERLITKEAIKRFVDELPVCTI